VNHRPTSPPDEADAAAPADILELHVVDAARREAEVVASITANRAKLPSRAATPSKSRGTMFAWRAVARALNSMAANGGSGIALIMISNI